MDALEEELRGSVVSFASFSGQSSGSSDPKRVRGAVAIGSSLEQDPGSGSARSSSASPRFDPPSRSSVCSGSPRVRGSARGPGSARGSSGPSSARAQEQGGERRQISTQHQQLVDDISDAVAARLTEQAGSYGGRGAGPPAAPVGTSSPPGLYEVGADGEVRYVGGVMLRSSSEPLPGPGMLIPGYVSTVSPSTEREQLPGSSERTRTFGEQEQQGISPAGVSVFIPPSPMPGGAGVGGVPGDRRGGSFGVGGGDQQQEVIVAVSNNTNEGDRASNVNFHVCQTGPLNGQLTGPGVAQGTPVAPAKNGRHEFAQVADQPS